jgi:hypothetical protein
MAPRITQNEPGLLLRIISLAPAFGLAMTGRRSLLRRFQILTLFSRVAEDHMTAAST